MLRFDFVEIDKKARITEDGYIVDKPILTRSGIFEYREPNGKVRREYRPPEEVFHADHLASLRGKPVTDGHPGRVHAGNTDAIVGAILGEGEREDNNLLGEVVIHAPKKLGERKELSLGYSVELDETPGEIDGQRYDAIQRNLRVNHLAVVHRGRAGNARLRLDHDDAAETSITVEDIKEMATDPVVNNSPKLVSVRLDSGIEYHASPEVAIAYKTATDGAATAKARADAVEAERDALKAEVAAAKEAHQAALVQARADAVEAVKARLVLEAEATKHSVTFTEDMDDRKIRETVVEKLSPNIFKFDGKSDDYVSAAFDAAIAKAAEAKTVAGNNRAIAYGAAHIAPLASRADAASSGPVRSSAELRARLSRAGV